MVGRPSNENPTFTRTHVGGILNALQQLPGSSLQSVALSAERLRRASQALDELTEQRLQQFCHVSSFGFVRFSEEVFHDCPTEIAFRFLGRICAHVRGQQGPLKLHSVEKLYERMFVTNASRSETLGGAHIAKSGGEWIACREPGRLGLPEIALSGKLPVLWDQRVHITDMTPEITCDQGLMVKRIGPEGWQILKACNPTGGEDRLPARVRNNLPAVWLGDRLLAAPLFSCDLGQSAIAQDRFKMVFKPLI